MIEITAKFSKKYLLQGCNVKAVRQLLSPAQIKKLETNEPIYIEGRDEPVIFYLPYSQPEPAAIESFYRTVKETRQAFLNR